jgi:hypothetical protein
MLTPSGSSEGRDTPEEPGDGDSGSLLPGGAVTCQDALFGWLIEADWALATAAG